MFRIEDNRLITGDGTISFETPIREVIEKDDMVIVRLGLMGRKDDVNNVYGVKDGQIIWRVQALAEYNPLLLNPLLPQRDPFTRIKIYEEDPALVIGTTCDGFRYLIDPSSGKIVGEESWVK